MNNRIRSQALEQSIVTKGREIFARMEGGTPRVFSRSSLTGG
jgi:hypothetical protein